MIKTKTKKMLPKKSLGTVHAQFVRCGKKVCRCSRGELHGAYFYHFARIGGKLRKRYLKASEIEEIRAACDARQAERKSEIDFSRFQKSAMRQIREHLRQVKAHYGYR